MNRDVQLSVIVAGGRAANQLAECLASLARQSQLSCGSVEIIVCHSCHPDPVLSAVTQHSDIVFLHMPENAALPDLLGKGIARARGRVVAVTDAACRAGEHWFSAILAAHANTSAPVIGGAVEPGRISSIPDWAAYFSDYAAFMPPVESGVAGHAPGNNLSFKREAAGDLKQFERTGFWKAHWCMDLQRRGHPLVIEPRALVYSTRSVRLKSYIRSRFQHGRCFAGMRAAKFSKWRRFAYAGGSSALPFVLFARIVANVVPKKRHLKEFILSSPIIVLSAAAWSSGECCGYLRGTGQSCSAVRFDEG